MDTNEIRNMISLATVGDGDQVLNILEKVCDKLDELDRRVASAARNANDALTYGPGIVGCE